MIGAREMVLTYSMVLACPPDGEAQQMPLTGRAPIQISQKLGLPDQEKVYPSLDESK